MAGRCDKTVVVPARQARDDSGALKRFANTGSGLARREAISSNPWSKVLLKIISFQSLFGWPSLGLLICLPTCLYLPACGAVKINLRLLLPALQRHSTENSKQIFSGKELHGYSPNSCIHVSVSDLYICIFLWTVCLFCCRKIGGPNHWSVTDKWMWKFRLRPRNSFLGIHKFKFLCSVLVAWLCEPFPIHSISRLGSTEARVA